MRANELVHLSGRRSANTIRARGEVVAHKAGYTTASSGYVVIDRKSLARRGRSIHVVLFEQDRADQADDCLVVAEDTDDLGAALDLAVDPFDRVGRVQLDPMHPGEGNVCEDIGLGLVHDSGELGHLGADLVGDGAPLDFIITFEPVRAS